MGIPFTVPMGFLFTMTIGFLFTIALGIQLTISTASGLAGFRIRMPPAWRFKAKAWCGCVDVLVNRLLQPRQPLPGIFGQDGTA
jgi:hypothetical protein